VKAGHSRVPKPDDLMPKEHKYVDRFLKMMVDQGGSDLHIKSGSTPKVRINGNIGELCREILAPQAVDKIIHELLGDSKAMQFRMDNEIDLMYDVIRLGRFRINVYKHMFGVAIAIRHINLDLPDIESLGLPKSVHEMINRNRGLILVTGSTGSGKSTTLAAMIEEMNNTRPLNIITIEDPIEYEFREKTSIIQQREIGSDTPSWAEALKRILRQDPDVIMLGEIRDRETMQIALTAANTGHLVMSTLHTVDSGQTINRIISMVPSEMGNEIRILLAETLVGIISQRLLPRADKPGRIPAVEILIANETVKKMIINPTEAQYFRQVISEGKRQYGMQTFDQSLMQLHKDGMITMKEALKYASSPTDFRIQARGIGGSSGMDWEDSKT